MSEYPKEFLDLLESVTAKRPRTVIQHILEHGFITSEELKDTYGYNHPPRAVRDVREYGNTTHYIPRYRNKWQKYSCI